MSLDTKALSDLTAVEVSAIRPGTRLGVPIYVKTTRGFKMFNDANSEVDDGLLADLRGSGIGEVFVEAGDLPTLDEYVAANLIRDIAQPQGPIGQNTGAIRISMLSVARSVLRDPSRAELRRVRSIFEATVDRIEADLLYLPFLIKTPSGQFSVDRHMVSSSLLSMAAAFQLGVGDRPNLLCIGLGGFLHDIGYSKVRISAELDHFTFGGEAEVLVHQHTMIGHDIVADSLALPDGVAQCVLSHHERLDGGGYPDGLLEEKTPLAVRITAAVDLFDWLTSTTSGRPAYTSAEAVEQIKDGTYGKVDSRVCKALVLALASSSAATELEVKARDGSVDRPRIDARPAGAPTSAKTVLVVDDDDSVLKSAQAALEAAGYVTLTGNNSISALRLMEEVRVDALVTDIFMPSMTGFELSARIKQLQPDLPVVVMSDYPNLLEDDMRCQNGASASVQKPFSPAALRSAVDAALVG